MTALYEYRVEFEDDRDDEVVEVDLPPNAAVELYGPGVARVEYVGRVA